MSEPFGTVMDLDTWKLKALDGEAPSDAILHKDVDVEIKADEESNTFSFTISTEAPDRDKDVIKVEGWDLDNFKKNPVVLFAHDYKSLPIGKATSVEADGNRLKSTVEFVPADTPVVGPMAAAVSQLLKGGFLNATSVGFRPLTHSYNDERGGFDFEKTELLEYSIVPVPAHPDALQDAKSAGIDVSPVVEWAKALVVDHGWAVTKEGVPETTLSVAPAIPAESVVKIEISDDLKALMEKLDEPKALDLRTGDPEPLTLEVDFDPEPRLFMEPDPEPEIDIDALKASIKQAFMQTVREEVGEVARDRVNALRGRVD